MQKEIIYEDLFLRCINCIHAEVFNYPITERASALKFRDKNKVVYRRIIKCKFVNCHFSPKEILTEKKEK